MPSPVVVHAAPVESIAAPRRPHAPPLPALKLITLCCGSSSLTADDAVPGVGVRHPEHVPDQIERPALAGVEHEGGCRSSPVAAFERAEHAVAGHEVDRPAALRIGGADHRRVAAASRPEEAEVRRILRLVRAPAAAAGAAGGG